MNAVKDLVEEMVGDNQICKEKVQPQPGTRARTWDEADSQPAQDRLACPTITGKIAHYLMLSFTPRLTDGLAPVEDRSYPSEQRNALMKRIEKLEHDNTTSRYKIKLANAALEKAQESRNPTVSPHAHDSASLLATPSRRPNSPLTTCPSRCSLRAFPVPQKERAQLLEQYIGSKAKVDQLEVELARLAALDPDRLGRLEHLIVDLQELALHWNG